MIHFMHTMSTAECYRNTIGVNEKNSSVAYMIRPVPELCKLKSLPLPPAAKYYTLRLHFQQ